MADASDTDGLPVSKLQQQLRDYRGAKQAERDEGRESDRYYHGDQWSADEIATLNERKQPVITFNRCQRKIDGIVGLIERLRQDPKAYPRTPSASDGAELATTVLNYGLDASRWKDMSPDIARDGALGPVAGIEFDIVERGDKDPDVRVHPLDRRGFFYDPRSRRLDFSDARFMGVARWIDLDLAIEMFPDREQGLKDIAQTGESLPHTDDGWGGAPAKDGAALRSVFLVESYYIRRGRWRFAFWCGTLILDEGDSPFPDTFGEKANGPRYVVFSASIDHDGDRYGFIRNLKGPQDEINHRRSKGVHALHSRRLVIEGGTVEDVDAIRAEYHLPDGVVTLPPGSKVNVEDNAALAQGNLEMLTEAKNEIENFGPNPALIGQGIEAKSGRAIALLQQAGIAELGPFLIAYRAFKTRLYRGLFALQQELWTSQRWIRVTDDEGLAQFLTLNERRLDPATGQPTLVNALGEVDVDLIVDEGPDQVNSMADAFDTLVALAQQGAQVPPDIILELSSLPSSVKKQILGKLQQASAPNPMAEQAAQIEMAGAAAKVDLTKAQTAKALSDAQGQPGETVDPDARALDLADKAAGVDLKRAQAEQKRAEPAIQAQRTNDQAAHDANRIMVDLAKVEQQRAAQPGLFDSGYRRTH